MPVMTFGVCNDPSLQGRTTNLLQCDLEEGPVWQWKTMNAPHFSALFKDLRNRIAMTESMHIQLHSSDFAHLPLSGDVKWLIEFPSAWSWFLSWSPGIVPEHLKDPSMTYLGISIPCFSSRKWTSLVIRVIKYGQCTSTRILIGVPDAFIGTCSAYICDVYGAIYGFGFTSSNQPTLDQPPQFAALPVPKQQSVYVGPTSKMTSSAPALIPSSRFVPTSLPAPLPQQPMLPRQTECIQNPVPLEQLDDFLATDIQQQAAPEDQSSSSFRPTLQNFVPRVVHFANNFFVMRRNRLCNMCVCLEDFCSAHLPWSNQRILRA